MCTISGSLCLEAQQCIPTHSAACRFLLCTPESGFSGLPEAICFQHLGGVTWLPGGDYLSTLSLGRDRAHRKWQGSVTELAVVLTLMAWSPLPTGHLSV